MKRIIGLAMAFAMTFAKGLAFDFASPKLASPQDTVTANRLIQELRDSKVGFGDKVALAALNFAGVGEDDYYTTDSVAELRINLNEFSPLMLVNSAVSLAKASEAPGEPDWRTFGAVLESISCAKGVDAGFPSIMYHTSEWVIDNLSRGNLKELTEDYSGMVPRNKSLDEMTRKRENYAALADSATYEKVRMKEMGFRTLRVPTLKKETIKKKEVLDDLRNGDIIILVPNRDGIDCYDIGVVSVKEDGPHLIHVSPQTKTVVEEPENLIRYMQLMTKHFQGYRILRPQP